jgi:glutathione peroxidase
LFAGLALVSASALYVSARPADRKADVIKEPTAAPAKAEKDQPVSPLDFKLKSIDGKDMDLAQFKGKAVLLVNVASKCGFTPQYKDLEAVYEKYKDKGFVIVGFPANNFGAQEPGTEAEIKQFCSSKYNVTFPMTSKISVKGDDQHPLYKFLTSKETGGDFAGDIEWNFCKFLVDRNGNVIARFMSKTKPSDPQVVAEIEKALAAPAGEKTASAK